LLDGVKTARVAVAGRYLGPVGAALAKADEDAFFYPATVLAIEAYNAVALAQGKPPLALPPAPEL